MATYQETVAAALAKQLEAENAAKSAKDQQAKIGFDTTAKQYEEAYNQAKRLYDTQKLDVASAATANAKAAYTNKMLQEKTLPNVLQRSGLAGQGVSETIANAIGTNYQNAYNQVMSDKGRNIRDIDNNVANAQSQWQSGLAGAQGQYQQNLVGNQGDYQSRTLNIKAQYEADLANYLESLRKQNASSGSSNSGGSSQTTQLKDATSIRSALNQVQFDMRKGTEQAVEPLLAFLKPYVDKKIITKEQANQWINEILNSYANRQPTTVNQNNVSTSNTQNKNVVINKKTTQTKSQPLKETANKNTMLMY